MNWSSPLGNDLKPGAKDSDRVAIDHRRRGIVWSIDAIRGGVVAVDAMACIIDRSAAYKDVNHRCIDLTSPGIQLMRDAKAALAGGVGSRVAAILRSLWCIECTARVIRSRARANSRIGVTYDRRASYIDSATAIIVRRTFVNVSRGTAADASSRGVDIDRR